MIRFSRDPSFLIFRRIPGAFRRRLPINADLIHILPKTGRKQKGKGANTVFPLRKPAFSVPERGTGTGAGLLFRLPANALPAASGLFRPEGDAVFLAVCFRAAVRPADDDQVLRAGSESVRADFDDAVRDNQFLQRVAFREGAFPDLCDCGGDLNIGEGEAGAEGMLKAKTQEEMNEKIVRAFIDSGRVLGLLPIQSTNSTSTKMLSLRDYANDWLGRKRKLKETTRTTYKKYLVQYIMAILLVDVMNHCLFLHIAQCGNASRKLLTCMEQLHMCCVIATSHTL